MNRPISVARVVGAMLAGLAAGGEAGPIQIVRSGDGGRGRMAGR